MNDIGHLYVLANSAMPGLVKVGKTSRSPAERARELSSVTGLPSPFIVVYEQLFANCSDAEVFVHTYLAKKGHTVSENREFFSAPTNDVVRAIMAAPGAMNVNGTPELDSSFGTDGELGEIAQISKSTTAPWEEVYHEAGLWHRGSGEMLQDNRKALKLYLQSIKLGAIPAYSEIGMMYFKGEGVQKDVERALGYLTEGAAKGNIHCHWAMGMIFMRDKEVRHFENAEKCFRKFISAFTGEVDEVHFTNGCWSAVVGECYALRIYQTFAAQSYPAVLDDFFSEYGDVIAKSFSDELLEIYSGAGQEDIWPHLYAARDYFFSVSAKN
jgi:hypothetical protein